MRRTLAVTTCMTAIDTNILFYAHDARDKRKQQIAGHLIESIDDGALVWQVACEYLWASRKLEPQGYSYPDAFADIREPGNAWKVILPSWQALNRVPGLRSRGFSHWDALLVDV